MTTHGKMAVYVIKPQMSKLYSLHLTDSTKIKIFRIELSSTCKILIVHYSKHTNWQLGLIEIFRISAVQAAGNH